jgi:hypothetical protein
LQYDQSVETLLVEIFGPLSVAFVLFVIVMAIRRSLNRDGVPRSKEELLAAREAFRARLRQPNAVQVEQGMGGCLPQRLLTLYDDQQTILSEQIEICRPGGGPEQASEWIEAFLPLDLESQKYACDLPAQGLGKGFCFATDGTGNFYWIPLGEKRQADAPVFYVSIDPRANDKVADTLDEFLSRPRTIYANESELTTSAAQTSDRG